VPVWRWSEEKGVDFMKHSKNKTGGSQLPVCVVTGFLGAGKTSLLNHFMSSDHGLRVGVIVNDFGAIDIDSQLVENMTEDTVSLRNGCICCSIQDDFFDAVLKLVQRKKPPEVLVIETSGVSDPRTVVVTLTAPSLSQFIRVDSVISVVDCDSFDDLGEDESRLAAAQIGMADLVVFNKIDLADEAKQKRVEDNIRRMAPMARLFHTTHGQLPIAALLAWDSLKEASIQNIQLAQPVQGLKPLMPSSQQTHSPHEHRECCGEHDPDSPNADCCGEHHHHKRKHEDRPASLSDAFESCSFVIESPLSMEKVRDTIMDLPLSIYRLKGLFHVDESPDKQLLIQVVGPRISAAEVKPWGGKSRCSEIVAIGLKGSVDESDLKSRFESCIATRQRGILREVKERVQFWRRGEKRVAEQAD
jgi:G3E family GTPase